MRISINDPRVPAGWREGNFVTGKLAAKSHALEWDTDRERVVLRSLTSAGQSFVCEPNGAAQPGAVPFSLNAPNYIAPAISRAELLAHLDQYLCHDAEGGIECEALGVTNYAGQPFLAGYVSTWDTPTLLREDGSRIIIRRGAFTDVLNQQTDLLADHRGDLVSLASTAKGNLVLREDAIGLLFFADLARWPLSGFGLSVLEAAHANDWGMSLRLTALPSHSHTFERSGQQYYEVSKVADLAEISATPAPSNPSTLAAVFQLPDVSVRWQRQGTLDRMLNR